MKDRVPVYPGRVKLVPVSGQENVYDMTRADKPTQDGDPLNKATLLKDATAALFGLGTDAVPDDVLAYLGKYNQYWWKRRTPAKESYQASESVPSANYFVVDWQSNLSVSYSDSYSLNQSTGEISLVNPTTETLRTNSQTANALNIINTKLYGKYFTTSKSNAIYKINKQLVADNLTLNTDWQVLSGIGLQLTSSKIYIPAGEWEYIQSSDRSAYPDSGEQDGYEYQYLGIPFENAATAPKIATGSYVGTGKYGPDNPNSLTFEFPPKLLFITQYNGDGNFYGANSIGGNPMDCSILTTSYTAGLGFSNVSNSDGLSGYAKKTEDGKTITWYHSRSADSQANYAQYTYYYFAIG